MQTTRDFELLHSKIVQKKEEKDTKYGWKESDYIIKSQLGKGAFGAVYKVKALNNKTYTLKKIPISNLNSKRQQLATLNEVKLLQSIKYQHIIKVYHSFIDDGYFYILMEYASGGDLYQLAQNTKSTPFSQKQLWKWAYEILLAIRYLHDNWIIHWDIKASNIFITKKKRIKIGDFGCSRILNPAKMYLKEDVGTTVYLSPEQVNRVGLYDYKIDIWAIGWWLYYLAVLKPPFTGSTYSSLSYSILNEEPKELPADYSEEFKLLISKALTKNSKERPTAIELCLLIPAQIINDYTHPNPPNLASLTFMNPTKSAMGRQKSTSKREVTMETLKVSKSRKNKFKTPKRGKDENMYTDAYATHQTSWVKKTPGFSGLEEKKSSMSKLGNFRMREKPYERLSDAISRKYSLSGASTNDDSQVLPRVSRIRDICKFSTDFREYICLS